MFEVKSTNSVEKKSFVKSWTNNLNNFTLLTMLKLSKHALVFNLLAQKKTKN
jgi:hypothetical protein